MRIVQILGAFLLAVVVAFVLASLFYTQQVLAKQAEIGAIYTAAQQTEAYWRNLVGLAPSYGPIMAIALGLGFLVAAGVKRILTPLAPIAYPVAGAAAVFTVLWAVETFVAGGGVGAIGGARDALGVSLQMAGGFMGGVAFAALTGGK